MTPIGEESTPVDFSNSIALPKSGEQAQKWQMANRTWWENHPMRYDWKKGLQCKEFTPEFYAEIDARFFPNARQFMPWRKEPFDALIDFDSLKDKDVLEIGVGNGSHAQLLAKYARSFTGIDLTEYSVNSTAERMRCFGYDAKILRMDAERMDFPDNSFDFIWSWGVIHHSSDPRNIIKEMHRVLRPGGRAVTMVYHRSFWGYYIVAGFFKGILQGDLFKTRSLHKTVQRWADGAMARFYTAREWTELTSEFFTVEKTLVYGSKAQFIPLPGGRVKNIILTLTPDPLARFLTNTCRMGQFLVARLRKP